MDRALKVLDQFLDVLAVRVAMRLGTKVKRKTTEPVKRDMRCRASPCRKKSMGPRYRYLCEEHQKMPVDEQVAAVAKYAQRQR